VHFHAQCPPPPLGHSMHAFAVAAASGYSCRTEQNPMLHASIIAFLALVAPGTQAPDAHDAAPPTVALEGRVLDEGGLPIPVAQVIAYHWRAPDEVLAKGSTDGDGVFRLARLPDRSEWSLRVTAPSRTVREVRVEDATRPTTIVLPEAVIVRGTLRNRAGTPIAGAGVSFAGACRATWNCFGETTTAADGTFALPAPRGPLLVMAVVPGEGLQRAMLLVAGETTVTLQPVDEPRTAVHVAVKGLPPQTSPPHVHLSAPQLGLRLPRPWRGAQLDAKGTSSFLDLPDTDLSLRVSAPGYTFVPDRCELHAGGGPHHVTFTALAAAAAPRLVAAVVRDANDQPVAGIVLRLRSNQPFETTTATSGADGDIQFSTTLPPGTPTTVSSLDNRWTLAEITTPDGRPRNRLDTTIDANNRWVVRVLPAHTVEGQLLTPDGRPAAFAQVQLEDAEPTRARTWTTFAVVYTDRNGRYRFNRVLHTENPLRIHTNDPRGSVTGATFTLDAASQSLDHIPLRMDQPAVIQGTARNAEGKPAAGHRVWLRELGEKNGSIVEVIADREGCFRFVGAPLGRAMLQLLPGVSEETAGGHSTAPFEVESGKTSTHDLALPAR
jgi:hypothetical protein